MPENGKERRDHLRKEVNLSVCVRSDSLDDFVEKFAKNISKGGFFIRSDKPYPIDTEIQFKIQLKDGSCVLRGKGRVTWSQAPAGPGQKSRIAGMGVTFTGLDASSLAMIRRIIDYKGESSISSKFDPEPFAELSQDEEEEAITIEEEATPEDEPPEEEAEERESGALPSPATPGLAFWHRLSLRHWLVFGGSALGALILMLVLLPPGKSAEEAPADKTAETKDTPAAAAPLTQSKPKKTDTRTPPPANQDPLPAEPASDEVETAEKEPGLTAPPSQTPRPNRHKAGYLSLNTSPWVEVYLGPRKLGVTPLVRVKLQPGKHRLKLVNWEEGINIPLVVKIRPRATTKLVRRFSP